MVDFIADRCLDDVILVGHSFGGTIICKVVEAIPERIRRLVFYAGLVLRDGESVYDAAPPTNVRPWTIGTEDCVPPPGEWQLHPRMTNRLGPHRLHQIPGGHELVFSNPQGLADSIVMAGRG